MSEPIAAPPQRPLLRQSGAAMRFDSQEPLTAILVRHGVTQYTATGAYSGGGVPGPHLTAHGRVQAAHAADLVHRIGRELWQDIPRATTIVASPMVRAQETATVISRRLGRPITTDSRLAEANFGDWEGLTAAQIDETWPGHLRAWHETGSTPIPGGGESIEMCGERLGEAMGSYIADGVGRTIVIVSHAVSLRTVIGRAFGGPSSQWHRIRIAPASVSIIQFWGDGTSEISAIGIPPEV
jgi:broad specificity phosphatase PhoE